MKEKIDELRIAGVVRESIVDGPGIRFTIFCQGCPHGCEDCHNPETHDFNGGYMCSFDKILDAIDQNPLLAGVTFSGGEPMCQPEAFYELGLEIKKRGLDLMVFTGYTYEQLLDMSAENEAIGRLLSICDYLVDGRYDKDKRDLRLHFRGSSNQRFIDLNLTREKGHIVLSEK